MSTQYHRQSGATLAECLTERETREVIALWIRQKNQPLSRSEPVRLEGLAGALEMPEAEAACLLAEARRSLRQKARKRRWLGISAAAAALAWLGMTGYRWNRAIVDLHRYYGSFTVLGTKSNLLWSDTGSGSKPTHALVEVVFRYHPPSLWHCIVGPKWSDRDELPYLTDANGKTYRYFTQGAVSSSLGQTPYRPEGRHVYIRGYSYSTALLPASAKDLTLHVFVAADNKSPVEFSLPVPPNERRTD